MSEAADLRSIPVGKYADLPSRLQRAAAMYAQYPLPFLAIAIVNLPISLGIALWEYGWVLNVPGILVSQFVAAATAFASYDAVTGTAPSAARSYGESFRRLGALVEYLTRSLGAVLLLAITLIGIPLAIRVAVRWVFGTQAIMIYGDDAKAAISRSCRLVEGSWWRVFGNLLTIGLLVSVVPIALVAIDAWPARIASAVWSITISPFLAIFLTVLFFPPGLREGRHPAGARRRDHGMSDRSAFEADLEAVARRRGKRRAELGFNVQHLASVSTPA